MDPWCQCACDSCQYRIHLDHDTPGARQRRFDNDRVAAEEDVYLILLSRQAGMALWAIPAVWAPTGDMEEYANTVIAIVHNIQIGVLDRLGQVQDQEGPLVVY